MGKRIVFQQMGQLIILKNEVYITMYKVELEMYRRNKTTKFLDGNVGDKIWKPESYKDFLERKQKVWMIKIFAKIEFGKNLKLLFSEELFKNEKSTHSLEYKLH